MSSRSAPPPTPRSSLPLEPSFIPPSRKVPPQGPCARLNIAVSRGRCRLWAAVRAHLNANTTPPFEACKRGTARVSTPRFGPSVRGRMVVIYTTLWQRHDIKCPCEERLVGGRQAGIETGRPVHMSSIPSRPGRGTDLVAALAIDAHGTFRGLVREKRVGDRVFSSG